VPSTELLEIFSVPGKDLPITPAAVFKCETLGDSHGLRRPASSRRELRAAPGLPWWIDAVLYGL